MLNSIASWTEKTAVSELIQDTLWLIPMIQSLHILAIGAVLAPSVMISARMIGLGPSINHDETLQRFRPWIVVGLCVLALTGLLLVVGEPTRSLTNPIFQIKMGLLLAAVSASWTAQASVVRKDGDSPIGLVGQSSAVLAITLWIAVIFAGRWIAYF